MQRNVPAEKASAPAVKDDAALPPMPAEPSMKRPTPAGIINPKPRLTRCIIQRADPLLTIKVEIVERIGRLVHERGKQNA